MSKVILIIWCIVHVCVSYGQVKEIDSLRTINLPEVIIHQDKLKASEIGLNETSVDSLVLVFAKGTTISELIRITGTGQIRSYGPSGLSTPSFRGTGGSHTAILWNGISIQSPLSGQQDLSQVPIDVVDDIKIQKGGSGSLYGSGAIGGSIQLNNIAQFNQGFRLSTNQKVGSFGNHYQNYQIRWSNKKFSNKTSFFRRVVDNDYKYTNQYVRPIRSERRVHSKLEQNGILQQNDWKLNDRQLLSIKFWYQNNNYEIPNSILANQDSEAIQKDSYSRTLLTWNLDQRLFSITYKQAYFWHKLNYRNGNIGINSNSIYKSWFNRIEGEIDLSDRLVLVAGINHAYELSDVDNFGGENPSRNNTAMFGSLRYKSIDERLLVAANIREELVNSSLTPFSPSLGISHQTFTNILFSGNISRNYRIPTFNDLYWVGDSFGNPDLFAETSWNEELGIEYNQSKKVITVKATFYNSIVDNWIQWAPTLENSTQWTPSNVKQVWSRGVETKLSGHVAIGDIWFDWNMSYNYTKTTNRKIDIGNIRSLGKQLFYTPMHEGNISLKTSYKTFSLLVLNDYTGKQFTDEDNSEIRALSSYNVLSTYFNKTFEIHLFSGSLEFKIDNLLDKAYENRRGYPTYGRNFSLGLNLNFNK